MTNFFKAIWGGFVSLFVLLGIVKYPIEIIDVFGAKEEVPFKLSKGKSSSQWTKDEILIALYCSYYDVENLGLTLLSVAGSIARSEDALIRKIYRLEGLTGVSSTVEYSRLDTVVFSYFLEKMFGDNEFKQAFYEAMIRASWKAQTGVTEYYENKLKQLLN